MYTTRNIFFLKCLWTAGLLLGSSAKVVANPLLLPGEWTRITPPQVDLVSHYGTPFVQIDPRLPGVLYVCSDMQGLWKSTDGGSNWSRLGTPSGPPINGDSTRYLDSPTTVAVDPADSKHLYATQGVRGNTLGFWESKDGGETWGFPSGFKATATLIGTRDMTSLAIDPTDFKHVLVGSHSAWSGRTNAGILETKDGGQSWIVHNPISSFTMGTMGVNFLYNPDLGIGDDKTWLVGTDGQGLWRTSDGGANFTRVSPTGVYPDFSISHGGQSVYYSKTGVLYTGVFVYPARSTDNGRTWTSITSGGSMPYAAYYTIVGDGETLYTMRSYADNTAKYNSSYLVSSETDGLTWKPYMEGKQKFDNGPYTMRFDKATDILYSANWNAGVWAMKVARPSGLVRRGALSGATRILGAFPVFVDPQGVFQLPYRSESTLNLELFAPNGQFLTALNNIAPGTNPVLPANLRSGPRMLLARLR